jgi:hypothetical protein
MNSQDFLISVEGITAQHAGELIFDNPKTTADRKRCKYTYLRCLEDIAQAILFSNRVIASKKLPKVGDESSGDKLLKEIAKDKGKIIWIEDSIPLKPEHMFSDDIVKKVLSSYLQNLEESFSADSKGWGEFLAREYTAYFYPNELLNKEKKEYFRNKDINDEKLFGKNYFFDIGLEKDIKPDFLNKSLSSLKTLISHNLISADKDYLFEFIRRVSLTHILIWMYYRKTVELSITTSNEPYFLSHLTRSTLSLKTNKNFEIHSAFWETLVPRILAPILKQLEAPDEIIPALIEISHKDKFEEFKKKIVSADYEYKDGKFESFEKIKKELESIFSNDYQLEKWGFNFTIGLNPFPYVKPGFERTILRKSEKSLEMERLFSLMRIPQRYDQYEKEAKRLFKELR